MSAHVADVKVPLVSEFGALVRVNSNDTAFVAGGIPQGEAWKCVEGECHGPATGFAADGQTSSQDGGEDACVLVDDIELVRIPEAGVPPECRGPIPN